MIKRPRYGKRHPLAPELAGKVSIAVPLNVVGDPPTAGIGEHLWVVNVLHGVDASLIPQWHAAGMGDIGPLLTDVFAVGFTCRKCGVGPEHYQELCTS